MADVKKDQLALFARSSERVARLENPLSPTDEVPPPAAGPAQVKEAPSPASRTSRAGLRLRLRSLPS